MENKTQNGFSFTYSAREQAEIKRIREKYTQKTEDENKMERLIKLDRSVTQSAQIVSLIFGIIGTLVLGLGMSLIMTDLVDLFGSHKVLAMVSGISIGLIGGAIAGLAYPIYNRIVKKKRKKLAPEIIRLTDELMK